MNIQEAIDKIHAWPEPYRSRARENIIDASFDLMHWPMLRKPILKDMTIAIETWEKIMETEE